MRRSGNDRERSFPARRAWVAVLLAALGSCSKPVEIRPPSGKAPSVRVLLFSGLKETEITIRGPYRILQLGGTTQPVLQESGDGLDGRKVWGQGDDVVVDRLVRTPRTLEFVPENVPVRLNGRRYRGSLRVSPVSGKLQVVNVVDLEGYLRGVIPGEMSPSWPIEALKAQAVAARTYALVKMAERKTGPYDVAATVADQKYSGFDKEDRRTDAAVAATAGQVLRHKGRSFTPWYHSCCGGYTADARQVFADASPVLRGWPCLYCTQSPDYAWSSKLSLGVLSGKLGEGALRGLSVHDIGLDGRVGRVMLHKADGTSVALSGVEFRARVGSWRTLRGHTGLLSTKFTVRAEGASIVFDGHGWGHGVGMCQWGARGMAEAQKNCEEILGTYYRGAELVTLY